MTLWAVPLTPWLLSLLLYGAGRRFGPLALGLSAGVALLLTLAVTGLSLNAGVVASYRWSESLTLGLERSLAGDVFAWLVPLVALPVTLYAAIHVRQAPHRLVALLLAFVGAMQLLVLASDLLTLLVAWELVGACSWGLILHRWQEEGIPSQAMHAFLATRLGDLGLYVAAGALFAGTGGFGYAALDDLSGGLLHVAVAGIVLAAAAKSAQLPFSAWLFAAMAGPVPASALLHSATMVAAGTFLLARLAPQLEQAAWFSPLVIFLGLATALTGGLVASCQGHAKRLLAASTSAQYGLMWVAVGAGFPGVALLHAVTHACLKAGLFLVAGLAERRVDSYRLADMRLGRQLPGVAGASLVLCLALAGVAPLGAAWSKEQIASAAVDISPWLALFVAIAGGLSALYATRFQRLAFGRSPRRLVSGRPPAGAERISLAGLALATLMLSLLWWRPFSESIAANLGVVLPKEHAWLMVVSLALVALGIGMGLWLTRGSPREAEPAWQPVLADWFGLPTLHSGVGLGVMRFARALARFDDRVFDLPLTRLAQGASAGASGLARGDDALLAVPINQLAKGIHATARGLARGDDRVVDSGLMITARCAQWLADVNTRRGEWLADGLPSALAQGVEAGGRWARATQSGQTHHYYTAMAAGLGTFFLLLLIGASM
ncbi:NADH-quinone oxidoreductase subunit L [Billgrantia sulfidoxydans]|uniref:NADH-quinone oxidoreductase subunit L n=1 Tax=Billgrantia sulfidoxydans TaxID=2733484 RepID=A0ABX7W2W3_9GAMM|nr:proton-conducting transporter membrane subunit [Halomonas sulfidoxydans]QTP54015.1 NADH-quinone oxidoreductase subunit L [Halomonas sulfidoxydans]